MNPSNPSVVFYLIVAACLAVAVAAIIGMNRARRFGAKLDEISERAQRIHKLVNGRLTEAYAEVAELKKQLADLFPGTPRFQREYEEAKKLVEARRATDLTE